jgi:SAM-dependent methyltransferase
LIEDIEYTGERMIPEYSDQNTFWEHIHRYGFAAEWVKNKRVLDIASGEGYGCDGLRRAGARAIIGVEINQEACARATRKYGIDVRVGNAEAIPIDTGSIDVVVSFETIEHVARPESFLQEVKRVLAHDGVFIVSTPDKDLYSPPGKGPNLYHCSEMTRGEFQLLLESTFDTVTFFGQRPQFARWWSPVSLISEVSPWDRIGAMPYLRRGILRMLDPLRMTPITELQRQNPGECIIKSRKSWTARAVNWSAVRPLRRTHGWTPMFLVAVAKKGN